MDNLEKIERLILAGDIERAYNEIIINSEKYNKVSEYWNLKGILCLKAREVESAINNFNRAIELDNKNSNIYYNLAYSYEILGALSESALFYGLASKYSTEREVIDELDNKYRESEFADIYSICKKNKRKTFIVLSSCGWGDVYQRMHHIARALSKFGNCVKYISPSVQVEVKNEFSIGQGVIISKERVRKIENVEIYQPFVAIKNSEFIWNNYFELVQNLLNEQNKKNEVVIITYIPNQVNIIKNLRGNFKHIYECVDDHSDTKYAFWANKKDEFEEYKLMELADAITTTSNGLYLQKSAIENRNNVCLSRNAVNEIDFIKNNDVNIPDDLKNIPEPRIVYSGAIFEWFDFELFYDVIEKNPDKSFIIIGFGNMELLKNKPQNLYLLGAKKHSELKKYLKYMQAAIIPFKSNTDIIINCDPIKHYEYLACNLPVITTFMPECVDKIYTYVCNDKDSFNRAINEALTYKININKVKEFISKNSWNKRAALLYQLSDNIDLIKNKDLYEVKNLIENMKQISNNDVVSMMEAMYLKCTISQHKNSFNKAYDKCRTQFVERNYLKYLVNFDLKECEKVILRSNYIDDIYKAEIEFLNSHNKYIEKEFLINMLSKNIRYCEKIYNNRKNHYKKILYKSEVISESIDIDLINNIFKEDANMYYSPLINKLVSDILRKYGNLYDSERFYLDSISYIDKYLKRDDRVISHKELFNIEVKKCPVCENNIFNEVIVRADGIKIVECIECGLAFIEKFPDINNIKKIYDESYYDSEIRGYRIPYNNINKDIMFSTRAEWITSTINLEDKNILDIGCATGEFLDIMKKFNCKCFGLEISEYGYKQCIKKNIKMFNKTLDKLNIKENEYTCITMWDVLEHSTSPMEDLARVYNMLKNDGKLYISVPNHLQYKILGKDCFGYNSSYEHLIYFEVDTIINMLKKVGFKIEQCFSANENNVFDIKGIGSHVFVCAKK